KGALIYNYLLKENKLDNKYNLIQDGEKVKFLYLKQPNFLRTNVIAFSTVLPEEFDLQGYYDYDTMFEKTVLDPLESVIKSIGWETKTNQKISPLEILNGY